MNSNNKEKSCCDFNELLQVSPILFLFLFICFLPLIINLEGKSYRASLPKFSIEAIKASNIDISSLPSSLSVQNLTIDFIVENRYGTKAEYRNMEISILYLGYTVWINRFGLYRQQKGEQTSIQVTFSNSPVKIRGEEVANAIIKENKTSGFGVFKVQIKGYYNNYDNTIVEVICEDVKLQFSTFTQEEGLQKICSTRTYARSDLF
ncbi:hypothetical protein A4A49_04136 [Nicotiana attenuata]|uniref:Late embryogenesis abundant protein LEA-2 subgroup domain-containing protein n=1 Tax=Nicotiana attenuata TaxID=49451 RepID=A0A314L9N9_NICAT|nr:hypothetical protein A4A49_04136 [Nicotiana attenuata]